MAILSLPVNLPISKQTWGIKRYDVTQDESNGGRSSEVRSPEWVSTISVPSSLEISSGSWIAFIMRLRGRVNQVALPNLARPIPRGTMRGSMTLSTGVFRGDTTLPIISAGEASKTLLKGDYLGIGSGSTQQLIVVTEDAISDGSGNITVNIFPAIRNDFLISEPITWDTPKALFRINDKENIWSYDDISINDLTLNLIESVD